MVVVNNASALGTIANPATVASGATLQLNAFTVAGKSLTLGGGPGFANNGALLVNGTSVWTGNLVIGPSTLVNINNGVTLTVDGTINAASQAGDLIRGSSTSLDDFAEYRQL
jgi:hypothetical protein